MLLLQFTPFDSLKRGGASEYKMRNKTLENPLEPFSDDDDFELFCTEELSDSDSEEEEVEYEITVNTTTDFEAEFCEDLLFQILLRYFSNV